MNIVKHKPNPNHIIGILRDSFSCSRSVFTTGSCFELFKILKCTFPNAEPWVDECWSHVWTKINDDFYDIYGIRDIGSEGLTPMKTNPEMMQDANNWKFKRGSWGCVEL